MAGSNPTILPRMPVPGRAPGFKHKPRKRTDLTAAYLCTAIILVLATGLPWARRWALSGCAIESLALIFGEGLNSRIFSGVPLWTFLASLNVVYAVTSTSWLLYGIFAAACYPLVFLTCLCQFHMVANFTRKILRKVLRQLHFTRDKIALFNIPALQIDTEVDGLFVLRGLTLSLSTLTIEAHGIELGIRISDDMELAMYVDSVTVSLFRKIQIGDIYGNLKGGKTEMTLGNGTDPADEDGIEDTAIFRSSSLLKAATAGSEGFQKRPKLRESLTGAYTIKDSSAKAGLDSVTTLSPGDTQAEQKYMDILTDIRTTSAVYQSRQHVRKTSQGENGLILENERDMRAAICAEMHSLSTIVHPPERSVRVTTLRKLSSERMRNFMHRMPFLLRLLLMPLTYFHTITISSINAAGSGYWLTAILSEHVFKHYGDDNAEIRRLQRRINAWLASANFCVELTDISALGQVPLSTASDIVTYLNFKDIMAYRTVPDTASITQVVRLAGADATFTIPSFLLPHHEHLIPPPPTEEYLEKLDHEVEEADGLPKTAQKENERELKAKDEATITMSVHGSLPATADQDLLNFIAAIVKATKIIEIEKDMDDDSQETPSAAVSEAGKKAEAADKEDVPATASTFAFENGIDDDDSVPPSPIKHAASFPFRKDPTLSTNANIKSFARHVRANLSISNPASPTNAAGAKIKEIARDFGQTTKDLHQTTMGNMKDFHQNTLDNMKKAVVNVAVNDRWIAKMVGKIATHLAKAQGDVGYSGGIPVELKGYRGDGTWATKILP